MANRLVDSSDLLEEQIRSANKEQYNNLYEVDHYLQKPYHALRLSLGISLLREGINKSFPKIEPSNITVLELASSTGRVAGDLASAGYKVTASDIETLPLSMARERGLNCIQFDASQPFPFSATSINAIFMGELIEHIFDTNLLLSECNRVLKHKGVLVITTPNLARLQDRFQFLSGHAPRQINPLHEYLKLHIRPFTYSLLEKTLEHNGFQVNDILSNYVDLELPHGIQLRSRLLAKLFPKLGGSLIVGASKVNDR